MHRICFITFVIAASMSTTRAQDTGSGAAKSKGKAFKLADGEKKPVVGVEVAPGPKRITTVKEFPVNQSGEPNAGLTPGVTGIDLRSDGVARWKFYVWNKTEKVIEMQFDMAGSSVADEEGQTSLPVGREFYNNLNQFHVRKIQPGTRFSFYLDIPAPSQPTNVFKVNLLGELTTSYARLKPFTVTLPETDPLFFDKGVFSVPNPAEALGLEAANPIAGEGKSLSRTPNGTASLPSLSGATVEERRFRELSEKGARFDGSISTTRGSTGTCRMVFTRMPRTELVKVKILVTNKALAAIMPEMELTGAFLESESAPSGFALKLIDKGKVGYTFTMEGNNISGQDESGNRYSFVVPRK
jgi:hypothetical protein